MSLRKYRLRGIYLTLFFFLVHVTWEPLTLASQQQDLSEELTENIELIVDEWNRIDSPEMLVEFIHHNINHPPIRRTTEYVLNNILFQIANQKISAWCKIRRMVGTVCEKAAAFAMDKGLKWFGPGEIAENDFLRQSVATQTASFASAVVSDYVRIMPKMSFTGNHIQVTSIGHRLNFQIVESRRDLEMRHVDSEAAIKATELWRAWQTPQKASEYFSTLVTTAQKGKKVGALSSLLGIENAYAIAAHPIAIVVGIFCVVIALICLISLVVMAVVWAYRFLFE